jgi:hypothetical protein
MATRVWSYGLPWTLQLVPCPFFSMCRHHLMSFCIRMQKERSNVSTYILACMVGDNKDAIGN